MAIRQHSIDQYGFDPGTDGVFNASSGSRKFFNRIDWNINANNQLVLRNNTILSDAEHMDRDQLSFRFGSIAYKQTNNQSSTVAELKTRFSNRFSNSLLLGYTSIHDYRSPQTDPAFPQVQIVGRTPGSTIFFGTDREASVFNLRQRTFEFTDNITLSTGKHTLTIGTHNEFYGIGYGFVNGWNGRVTYQSIEDYLANKPQRVQGNFHYYNNDRSYLLANPSAKFNISFLSLYIQDEIRISDRFRVTPGLRADYTILPGKQTLSDRTKTAIADPGFREYLYLYAACKDQERTISKNRCISPRLGFRASWGDVP